MVISISFSKLRSLAVAAALTWGIAGQAEALEHPCIFLNKEEIAAIKAKVKAGEEPWKSAAAKAMSIGSSSRTFVLPEGYGHKWLAGSAQSAVEKKYNYPYDNHRRTSAEFGVHLINAAMAWHITGEQKYADWCKRNINAWFLDPKTYMEPKGATVGLNASFTGVVVGVDLAWPALDAGMQAKVKDWFQKFHASVGLEFGGVGGNHNRADWAVAMKIVSGLMADKAEVVDLGLEKMKKRSVGAKGEISVGGSGDESRANYTYFTINALTTIAEACRHHGVDAYGEGGKMERLYDRYHRYYKNPGLWEKETGNKPSKAGYFEGHNFYPWELAHNVFGKAEYLTLAKKLRPMTEWSNAGGVGNPFGIATLTHSRGAYPYKIWSGKGGSVALSQSVLAQPRKQRPILMAERGSQGLRFRKAETPAGLPAVFVNAAGRSAVLDR